MRYSVVIATKDRRAFLARALDSLVAQRDAPPFETVVVDNGSRDDTATYVRERAGAVPFPLTLVDSPVPNRGAARNAGIRAARGAIVVFVDDDVWLPDGFVAAHARAQGDVFPHAVSGPIVNVPDYETRPRPSLLNYSGAFFCTCNVSVSRSSLLAVGGFDEDFDLYGWEDTELGLRLRRHDVRRAFAWDAHLWHVKPPASETLDVVAGKTTERARMAARMLRKEPGLRARLATGAYALNLARARLLAPPWSLGAYRALATDDGAPALVRAIARGQYLDGTYASTLANALARNEA